MKVLEEIRGAAAIRVLAAQKGIGADAVEAEIRQIIGKTWEPSELFPEVPSPALFVGRLAALARK